MFLFFSFLYFFLEERVVNNNVRSYFDLKNKQIKQNEENHSTKQRIVAEIKVNIL